MGEQTSDRSSSDGQATPTSVESSPRAFVNAAGTVFQFVGLACALCAVCAWLLSGLFVEPAATPAERWTDYLTGDRLPAAVFTIDVLAMIVGGLAIMTVGLGMQGERPESGRAGVVVAGMLFLVFLASAALLFVRSQARLGGVMAVVLALASTCLIGLAGKSAGILKRFPPPSDRNVVTDEMLQAIREEKDRHRSDYGA